MYKYRSAFVEPGAPGLLTFRLRVPKYKVWMKIMLGFIPVFIKRADIFPGAVSFI